MPPGRNPWYFVSALAFGIPWLAALVFGIIWGGRNVPDERVALVWVFVAVAVLALTGLLDVLAVATIWLALYALWGRETLVITPEDATIRRAVGPFKRTLKLKRGAYDRFERLDRQGDSPRVPRPVIEMVLDGVHARFGAGMSAREADLLADDLASVLESTGPGSNGDAYDSR